MARSTLSQTSFSTGEISPELTARVDIEQYKSGCQELTNFIAKPLGPARRRNGLKYVAEVKDSTKEVRLKKFQTRVDQTFTLEFGHQYIRFYTSNAQVVEASKTVTGITQANPGVVTSAAHGFSNGDQIYLDDVVGMTQVNGLRFTVAGVTANTFQLSGVNTTGYTAYSSGGTATRIYTLTSPYSESDLPLLSLEQIGDSIYIAHPDYYPRVLTRTDTTDWTLSTFAPLSPPSHEHEFMPATTLTPAATTGTGINFTAGAATFLDGDVGRELRNLSGEGRATITSKTSTTVVVCTITEDFPSTSAIASQSWGMIGTSNAELTPSGTKVNSIISVSADVIGSGTAIDTFRTEDIGSYINLNNGAVKILSITSASDVSCLVIKALNATTETGNWTLRQQAWNSDHGYPKTVTYYKGRLIFASTDFEPNTIWFSEAGNSENFALGTLDSDPMELVISSSGAIQWLAATRDLIVGTSNGELSISAGPDGLLTPSSNDQKPRTYIGSQEQTPILVDNKLVFIQGNQKQLVTYAYRYEIEGYEGVNLLLLADHLGEGLLVEGTFARQPNSLIYVVTEEGKLIAGSYLDSIGWSEIETDGTFESVTSISESNEDQVWVAVNRTINGSTKRYIEYFDNGNGEDWIDGFVDSYLVYAEPKTITGITKANPGVVTSTAHGFVNGDQVKFKDMSGMTELEGLTYTVANKTANTFELSGTNTTSYGTFVSGEVHKLVSTISGLNHLEGEVVKVKTDNASHPDCTVTSGAITLDTPAIEVVVGMPYTSTIVTLSASFNSNIGEMSGQKIRRVSPILRVYKSSIPTLNDNDLPSREPSDLMDTAVPLYTGDLYYGNLGWSRNGKLTIETSDVFPLQINGIFGVIGGGE